MDNKKFQEVTQLLFVNLVEKKHLINSEFQQQQKITNKEFNQLLIHLESLDLKFKANENSVECQSRVELLDISSIQNSLKNAKISVPVEYYLSTDSTNKQAKNNQIGVYLADHQNSGYGRNQKQWISPLGQCVALSIKYKFNLKLHQLFGLNIAIGVAVMNTLKEFNIEKVGLKWPNDIIGSDGKIAGILIEVIGNKSDKSEVIMGVGLNWSISSKLFKTVQQKCMNVDNDVVHRSDFTAELIIQIYKILAEFSKSQLSLIKNQWMQYDVYLNHQIKLIHNDSIIYGKYRGIDSKGALLIERNGQIESIINGEVSLRPLTEVD